MLAMADKNGRIWSSIPGLANRARVSIQEAEEALETFLSPDPYSRTPEHEGRRIEPIDGGWALLNHAKYRALRDSEERKEYKREWIKERRAVDKCRQSRPQYTKADTEADTNTLKDRNITHYPTKLNIEAWLAYKDYRKKRKIKPLLPVSEEKQIEKLTRLSKEDQQQCINDTIANGYQGIFPEKYGNNGKSPRGSKADEMHDAICNLPDD